jgi:hypothetical protein
MEPRFVQLEIRYTHILDFKDHYISIISRYLIIDDVKFVVNGQGSMEESVILTFPGNSHQIDFRFDRLIFRYEGEIDLIKKQMGPTKFFFDILDELQKVKTFGEIKQVLMNVKSVRLLEGSKEEIVKKFKEKFLKKEVDIIESDDYAVTVEKKVSNSEFHNLTFGPFSPEDMVKQNVSQLKGKFNADFKADGLFANYTISWKQSKTTFNWFIETINGILKTLNLIEL